MTKLPQIEWHDPREKIWGFHIHQELPLHQFDVAIVIQRQCAAFLTEHGISINAEDVLEPGYGPHLDYMWELRVENETSEVLEKLGIALSYMSINRFGLSAYLHPLMHDRQLTAEEALKSEGDFNQANALWFTHRVKQDQNFFYQPPRDNNNNIIDTRTPRIIPLEVREKLKTAGLKKLTSHHFQNPFDVIINGFHIHMDFSEAEAPLALTIFDHFLKFLLDIGLRPTSTRIYAPYKNGPHQQSGWEVKFETRDKNILNKIGIAIGWLMCNRQGLSVFTHPVTWEEGDHARELKAHAEYSMFIGEIPALDLNFFANKVIR